MRHLAKNCSYWSGPCDFSTQLQLLSSGVILGLYSIFFLFAK
jgi:hypothetical protein